MSRPVPRGLAAPFSDSPTAQPSPAPVLGQRDLTWQDAGETTTDLDDEENDTP
jgi:hypothetical protein